MTLPLTLLLPSVAMDRRDTTTTTQLTDGHFTNGRLTDGHLDRGHLDELWRLLRIPSDECRRKVLCEMGRDPEKFEPVSGVFYLTMR